MSLHVMPHIHMKEKKNSLDGIKEWHRGHLNGFECNTVGVRLVSCTANQVLNTLQVPDTRHRK